VANAQDEISSLDQASTKAYPAADQVAKFLESADDPNSAADEDACARYDLREQPGEADRRVQELDKKLSGDPTFSGLHGNQTVACRWANGTPSGTDPNGGNPGYSGLEGLLNYAYIQTNSLNLFDQLGHSLGITLVAGPGLDNACGYQTGPEVPDLQGGGGNTNTTTDPRKFAECAGILGDRHPGINYGTNPSGLFGDLKPYDGSVCPQGSTVPQICDPNVHLNSAQLKAAGPAPAQFQDQPGAPVAPTREQQKQIQNIVQGIDPGKTAEDTEKQLQQILQGLPNVLPQLPNVLPQTLQGLGLGSSAPAPNTSSGSSTTDLLNFLLGQ
jgi:hypothetical protein